ncbi:MAG: hypothetical protein WDN04_23160 [Rhodospirillales bacterium]
MIYQLYQAQADFLAPFRRGADAWLDLWGENAAVRRLASGRLTAGGGGAVRQRRHYPRAPSVRHQPAH